MPAFSAEQIIMLGTPVEGIYLTARALLEPGDDVIVLTPAYDALINLFEHIVGAENVKMGISPTATGWQLDLDDLRSLLSCEPGCLSSTFPTTQPATCRHRTN